MTIAVMILIFLLFEISRRVRSAVSMWIATTGVFYVILIAGAFASEIRAQQNITLVLRNFRSTLAENMFAGTPSPFWLVLLILAALGNFFTERLASRRR